jgi:hypothetical protein
VKAFGSEKYYRDWRANQLEKDPYYERALKDRLAVTDIEHSLASREEPFQSNYAERLPVVGHMVRTSGRAYNRFLVGQRFGIYKHLASHAEEAGISLDRVGKNGETLGEQIAGLAGSATGRGHGRRGGFFERNAVEMNAALFSPRLIKSRFDFLNPLAYHNLDPIVRAEKIKMAVKTTAAIGSFLYAMSKVAGVKVQIDPRSSDFGKIRIGNTRLDVAGGFGQYIRIIAQAVSNGEVDPKTGEIVHGQTPDILMRFARSKLAPIPSAGVDVLLRQNYAGKPLNPKAEIASRSFPLGLQDAYQTFQQTHNPAAALAAYGASAVGLGVQSYGQKKIVPKLDLKTDLEQQVKRYFHRGLTPQIREALQLRETRTKYLDKVKKEAKDSGKTFGPLERFNAQVDLLRKTGRISAGQAQYAKSWAARQPGAVGEHRVTAESKRIADKWFGGTVLTDAGRKLRAKGSQFYLSDH